MENLKDLFNIVNLNNLLGEYTTPLLNGIEALTLDLVIVATFLAVIDLTLQSIKNFGNIENVIAIFVERLLKFSIIIISIKGSGKIINFALAFFLEVGIAFGGNKTFLDGNGMFNFNQIWGHLGEIVGTVALIGQEFNGTHAIFYGLIILVVVILCSIILIAIFTSLLEFYLVGVIMFLLLPLNVFTSLMDLSKGVIKTFIISGLKISIYLVLMNISIEVLKNYLEELENIGISQSKNDISAMLFFIVLLGIICAVFLSMEGIAMYILTGSGAGLSFTRLGNMASQGINTAVSTGLTIAGIFAGGSGLAKLGVDVGVKGTQVAGGTVKSFSNVAKYGSKAVKTGANTLNKGIAKATDGDEPPKTSSSMDTLKKAKSVFQKGKSKK